MKKSSEKNHKSVSVSVLKEMKSSAFRICWKLTSDLASMEDDQKAMQEYEALIDRFCEVNKEYMAPQQYQAVKHDFEYFMRLVDLAYHYHETNNVDSKAEQIIPYFKWKLFTQI